MTTTRSKKKARVSNSTDDDNLSRLPDQILDIILCFLTQKEAVRTCVLSKSWRHVGPSRSKLELCHVDFDGDIKKFKSVMYNTIERYNRQNLFLKQLSVSSDDAVRLNLPSIASKAQLLEEMYLSRWNLKHIYNLSGHKRRPILFKHLRNLSLVGCNLTKEVLEAVISSTTCPLLERLLITDSFGFKNLNVSKALRLEHFEISHLINCLSSIEFDEEVPNLETISIKLCRKWSFLDNNYFPRLKSLRLTKVVLLSSETFRFFASDYMPSLEKLEFDRCCVCKEFKLSSSSIKYLSLISFSGASKITIDAPSISCFTFKAYIPMVPSISFTPISSEWKSNIEVSFDLLHYRKSYFPGIREIREVLESVGESHETTLNLYFCTKYQRRFVGNDYGGGLYQKLEPFVVEGLSLGLPHCSTYSTARVIVDYVFRVCRPRYISSDAKVIGSRELTEILWKLLLHERETAGYVWNQDLAEVSMEYSSNYDVNPKEWHSVVDPGKSLSECDDRNIRFRLKWRGVL